MSIYEGYEGTNSNFPYRKLFTPYLNVFSLYESLYTIFHILHNPENDIRKCVIYAS